MIDEDIDIMIISEDALSEGWESEFRFPRFENKYTKRGDKMPTETLIIEPVVNYELAKGGVQKYLDGVPKQYIPSDESLADWREYLAWVEAGNAPSPMPVEAVPTRYVSKLAIVDRLIAESLLEGAMAAIASDSTAKARWDAATEIDSSDETVRSLLSAVGADPDVILA